MEIDKNKIVCIIQGRLNSKRFPNKIIKNWKLQND